MASVLDLAAANLLSPMVLFFVLGLVATLARSDLSIPEAISKAMSLYLMLAIGFKGGVGVAQRGFDTTLGLALLAGIILSAAIPLVAFRLLMATSKLPRVDAAAHSSSALSNPSILWQWSRSARGVGLRVREGTLTQPTNSRVCVGWVRAFAERAACRSA
jgi:Na+-dependent bicarbonate transporter superfamily